MTTETTDPFIYVLCLDDLVAELSRARAGYEFGPDSTGVWREKPGAGCSGLCVTPPVLPQ